MAEAFLKSFDSSLEVYSAGTNPEKKINPNTVKVMSECGINLVNAHPKSVGNFVNQSFDYIITVCDNAKESCPAFAGKVNHRLHIGFTDPADAKGTEEQILSKYREVRDEINESFKKFYANIKHTHKS